MQQPSVAGMPPMERAWKPTSPRGSLQRRSFHDVSTCGCPSCAGNDNARSRIVVGHAHDPLEKEADRAAHQALTLPVFPTHTERPLAIRRTTLAGGEPAAAAPASVDRVLAGSGQPLADGVREDMEARLGHDFSNVRIYDGSDAARSAEDVRARAYATGDKIVFGDGYYSPATAAGRRLLAHELAHVVQQGMARPLEHDGRGSAEPAEPSGRAPMLMRTPLFNSTMKICHRVLESRGFAITEGGLRVTTLAHWRPSDQWQGTVDELKCGNPEFHITLVRDDPVFDNAWGDCTFDMGRPSSRQWTGLSDDDDWYLTIWTGNTNPNCCLEGRIEVEQSRSLTGKSCTKPPPGPLEILHGALDLAGMIPALGAVPDAINAGIYAIEGDWANAGLSAVAAVPAFGDSIKGASMVRKAGKEVVEVGGDVVQRKGRDRIANGLSEARDASRKAEQRAAGTADDSALDATFRGGKGEGAYETTTRLKRGNLGERLATDALADNGHKILSYKPDIRGTNQGGIDMVTMKGDTVYFVDNKALTRGGNVASVSALTTNFAKNKAAALGELRSALTKAASRAERDVLTAAIDAIEKGNFKRVVTNANLTKNDAVLSGVTKRLQDTGIEFIDVFRLQAAR